MINVLQAGRFFAAMAVVIHHAIIGTEAFIGGVPNLVQGALNYGYLGVDFFFVLSGFIINHTMNLKPRPALRFSFDRLKRIFVPYWPVGLTVAAAYLLLPSLSESGRIWGWVATITLLPSNFPPALSVAWTLQHEIVFYLLYAVLFYSGLVFPGMVCWVLLIILFNGLAPAAPPCCMLA